MDIIASIVLYKHSYHDVEKTLNSLFEEKTINLVVVVDNGSFCPWLINIVHPKLKIISLPENKGFGAGHNIVLNDPELKASYFLVCNPDIYFNKGEVDKLYEFSIKHNAGASIPKIIYPDGSMQYSCRLLPQPYQLLMRRFATRLTRKINYTYELKGANYDAPFFAPSLSGCFILVSQSSIANTHGFDERFFLYLEDVDFSRRIYELNHSMLYCPVSVVVHEAQRNSYKSFKFLKYHLISAFKYFNKWGWFFDKNRKNINSKCLKQFK